jgi:hypothetical protein
MMHKQDIDFMASHHLSTILMTRPLKGGFIDVHQKCVMIPIGWGGQLGLVHAQNFNAFLQSIHPRHKKDLFRNNITDNLDDLIVQAVKECSTNQSHMKWFVCYGQKPADSIILPSSSSKNSISTLHPTEMLTPIASPNLKDFQKEEECAWDSINDFIEGFTD